MTIYFCIFIWLSAAKLKIVYIYFDSRKKSLWQFLIIMYEGQEQFWLFREGKKNMNINGF